MIRDGRRDGEKWKRGKKERQRKHKNVQKNYTDGWIKRVIRKDQRGGIEREMEG